MANYSNIPETTKITVALPTSLLTRLSDRVPSRQRSRFIALAVEERLDIEEQLAALEETAGVWPDERYPKLSTEENIDRWLGDLRRSWNSGQQESNQDDLDHVSGLSLYPVTEGFASQS